MARPSTRTVAQNTVTPAPAPTPPQAQPIIGQTPVLETWEMQTDATVVVQVLRANRFGQPLLTEQRIGPNRKGFRFQLSSDDRREQQNQIPNEESDPFRNGLLVRVDAPQDADPEIASPNAVTDEQLTVLLNLDDATLQKRVLDLNEINTRRLLAMAESAGASYTKVRFLETYIAEHYRPGGSQNLDGPAERLS